ncbi:MAG: hypothetical protein QM642_01755 [Edaphocola sp.]
MSSIGYVMGLIAIAQLLMILTDTTRTILVTLYPQKKYDMSWVVYSILTATLVLATFFYFKTRAGVQKR